ncbi:PssE/Cps14G family polysaccharide biosynthesis glycosyltransferase [Radiobacillus sp. PE A8.2]|uniref:PssE/Cps14G family polysaccharide biosynthesis glycosyltransferase n=1 Tax=Radiobacillus sp. PE A8.2 TaxID=3380349 RepID=UPI00388D7625
MIFVVLGTFELPFTRLLDEVNRLKEKGVIKEDIVVQNGHTAYRSENMDLKPFVSYEEMDKLFETARLVITHAGTGSVITALRKHKKVIAVARLEKYGEHNDDHQLQLVDVLAKEGHILRWDDGEKLEYIIKQVESFEPVPFKGNKQKMIGILRNFIDKLE